MSRVLCGRKPWRALQTILRLSNRCAGRGEPKSVVNRGFLGFGDASKLRHLCISYPPRNFSKTDLQKMMKVALFLSVVEGFS